MPHDSETWLFSYLSLLVGRPTKPYAMLRPGLVFKKFEDFPSHRIFVHMNRALNIDKKINCTVYL